MLMLNPEFVEDETLRLEIRSLRRFRDISTGWWQIVSLTHRPPLPPRNTPCTHFCQRLSRPHGHSAIGRIMSPKCIIKYFTASRRIIKSNPKLIFCAAVCNTSKHDDCLNNVTLPMSDFTVKIANFAFRRTMKFTEIQMEITHKIKWEKCSIIPC